MKVQRFIAKDMPEAMKKIKGELGEQAVILRSKSIQSPGIFGLFSKKTLEVIAAVDEEMVFKRKDTVKPSQTRQEKEPHKQSHFNYSSTEIQEEMKEIKEMVKELTADAELEKTSVLHPALRLIQTQLTEQEVEAGLQKEILASLVKRVKESGDTEKIEEEKVKDWAKASLEKSLSTLSSGKEPSGREVITFVGPTGVGKTTTIAKIAARQHIYEKKKVALLTADTYRIGAVEQLKTYASILQIPIEVVYSKEDYHKALESFEQYDTVLVDTAGRNYYNKLNIEELKTIISLNEETKTCLVLSLTSKYTDMKNIFQQFSSLSIDQFIFTKTDETSICGPMINLMKTTGIGASFLTKGQNVPEDLDVADTRLVAELLFEENDHE
ncbi:flagellar biosynthesis protein FlhF [Thalassorhabdus alkalitolerans]|uniref:Flagellar biosynthesis protein FlhF n=1 Tax=Thalassorhabdus alkalitolerans TaxID=2282697 RepID=A0ABW0YPV5_9BACI